jgi:hypothetical protein
LTEILDALERVSDNRVAKKLTSGEIAEAKRRTAGWQPNAAECEFGSVLSNK